MVDEAGRQSFELEVAHAVATNNHCRLLTMESINNLLQGARRRIKVVAIELNSKAAAEIRVESLVPASANAKVGALRNDVDKASIIDGFENVGGAIGRMVVDNDDIKLERSLLRQSRAYSIGNGASTIEDRNDDRSLILKVLLIEVGSFVGVSIYQRSYLVEMTCGSLLHLHLHLTILRINIVELLFATLSVVQLLLSIQIFGKVENLALATEEQAQSIKPGIIEILLNGSRHIFVEQKRRKEQKLTKVEVVANASLMVIDARMFGDVAIERVVVVAINHCSIRIDSHTKHTFESILAKHYRRRLGAEEHIVGIGMRCNLAKRIGRERLVGSYDVNIFRHHAGVEAGAYQEVNMLNSLVSHQLADGGLNAFIVGTRQEAIYFFSHFIICLCRVIVLWLLLWVSIVFAKRSCSLGSNLGFQLA